MGNWIRPFALQLAIAWLIGMLAGAATAQTYDKNQQLQMPEKPSSNYSFLEGCWITDVFKHGPTSAPGRSTYCFNESGRGTLVFDSSAFLCRVAASASYQGAKLRIDDSDGPCERGGSWSADHLDCVRGADGVARCSGTSTTFDRRVWNWTVSLRRQGGPPAEARERPAPPPPAEKPKSLESLFGPK